MRTTIIIAVSVLLLSTICRADALDSIISETQSTDPSVRMSAFEALVPYLTQDPIDPRAVAAVSNLLILESSSADAVDLDGDYYSDLISAVVNLNDPSTIPALVDVIGSGNMVPRRLAQYGTAALGPVIARVADPDWIVRKCVMITLVNMLSPQNISLVNDPASMAEISAALGQGALDSSPFVSQSARAGLGLLPAAPPLSSGDACNGVYGGTFIGNIDVSRGQRCIIMHGTVSGSVHSDGGNVSLIGATIGGNVRVDRGGNFSILSSTKIAGDLEVQHLPSGSTVNQVCGSTVLHNLHIRDNAVTVQIGSGSPTTCGGNIIGGNLNVEDNSAPAQVFNNAVSGNIRIHDNSGSSVVNINTVGGSLDDDHNIGATQIFNNTITDRLSCHDDRSIMGGGNTAKRKEGQCESF